MNAESADDTFVRLNAEFFQTKPAPDRRRGFILVDIGSSAEFITVTTMKVAKAISRIRGQQLIVLASGARHAKDRRLLDSFSPHRVVGVLSVAVIGFLRHPLSIFKHWLSIRDGESLVAVRIDGVPVGMHFYDSILKRIRIPTVRRLTLKQRIYFLYQLAYFYGVRDIVDSAPIEFGVLADNTYRLGIVFELLRERVVPSLAGIDVNGLSAHYYRTQEDYEEHCRTPETALIKRIMTHANLQRTMDEYLQWRITGRDQQHDVMRAFGGDKRLLDRNAVIRGFGLDPTRKLVLVMSHVFTDAPHAYPKMLFRDYWDWIIQTCRRLNRNPHIDVLVKEHPSAVPLYGEAGYIDNAISEVEGFRGKIVKDVNTRSFFDAVDMVVTCGGTAGMEFPCFGVPVVVAARPPYARFAHIVSPETKEEYFQSLDRIHLLGRLSEENVRLARSVFFAILQILRIPKAQFGLGSQDLFMGSHFDADRFLIEAAEDCRTGAGFEHLEEVLGGLLNGGEYRNFVDESKIAEAALAEATPTVAGSAESSSR